MSVTLIAQKLIQASHFLSATEQEGERWGQPQPASDNEGKFRLLSKGAPADFSYSGTTTDDGNVGGTTVIDSVLRAFGDDYFIGGLVTITSGTCNGQYRAVTDFAQATGTLTTLPFTAQIVSGVTFTLTLAFSTREFKVELTASGDAGDAKFKWSHDGGTTYLGRAVGAIFDSVGSWVYDGRERRLILFGGQESPIYLRVIDSDTLRKLDVEGRTIESDLNYELRRKDGAQQIEPRLTMRGMYSYMADAATFEECDSGRSFQVAQEADNVALERAYLDARREPGEALLVVLQGRLTLVRYNNEPQFFLADAHVFYGLIADILEGLGPYTDADTVDEETLTRLREGLDRVERQLASRGR